MRGSLSRTDIIGTEYYCPPELVSPEARISPLALNAVDMWCWGMLLWYTLIDGKPYESVSGGKLTEEQLLELKRSGLFHDVALEYCQQTLYAEPDAPEVISVIIDALSGVLQYDPARRPDSKTLIDEIVGKLGLEPHPAGGSKAFAVEQSLPLFDASIYIQPLVYSLIVCRSQKCTTTCYLSLA